MVGMGEMLLQNLGFKNRGLRFAIHSLRTKRYISGQKEATIVLSRRIHSLRPSIFDELQRLVNRGITKTVFVSQVFSGFSG
jgi:hypothetical protein